MSPAKLDVNLFWIFAMRSKSVATTKKLPKHRKPKKKIRTDDEPGLPSIHRVKGDNLPRVRKSRTFPHVSENTMKSPNITKKLDRALSVEFPNAFDGSIPYLEEMLQVAASPRSFHSESAFRNHLSEGVLLNVNKMASNYIGIPVGEYVVYDVGSKKTLLIPTEDVKDEKMEFSESPSYWEVYTNKLLGSWNKIEKVLAEAEDDDQDDQDDQLGRDQPVGHSKYPRNERIKSAIDSSGLDQDELADVCGVDPSTVSRWTVRAGKGGRKPSLQHALCLSQTTGHDVESMFTREKGPGQPHQRRRRATTSSGGGRNPDYQRGAEE